MKYLKAAKADSSVSVGNFTNLFYFIIYIQVMANPKMQEKKNKLQKKKKAIRQKQKQVQKQIVTQTVHVHVNKTSKSKSRGGRNKAAGYSAPIVNVSVPTTMMRQVPFEVTNSKEYETQMQRAREQQQKDYSSLLNENIPIAQPIREMPQNTSETPVTNTKEPLRIKRVPQPTHKAPNSQTPMPTLATPLHTVQDTIQPLRLKRVPPTNKAAVNQQPIPTENLLHNQTNLKIQQKAKTVVSDIMKSALTNIANRRADAKHYEAQMRERQRDNEKDTGAGAGADNEMPYYPMPNSPSPTILNNYMEEEPKIISAEKINAAIAAAKQLTDEELAAKCVTTDGKLSKFATSLGIRGARKNPPEDVREQIKIKLGRNIITKQAGRPKTKTNINKLQFED
jgi:hypothetical protein